MKGKLSRTFEYFIDLDERGEFRADVRNFKGKTVFEIDGYEIFEDGFMRDKNDIHGLRKYLIGLGVMREGDHLIASNPAGKIHTKKWDRCVRDVKTKHEAADPYAVCTASLGYRGSVKAGHRRRNPVTKGYTSDSVYGPDNIYWKKGVFYFIGIPDDKTKPELFFTSDGWRKNYVLDPKYKNNLFWMPKDVGNAQFGFHATSAGQSLPSGYHMEAARSTLRTLSYPRHVTRSEARKKNPVNGFLLSVKNTSTGQRAYYTGEEPEAFDSNKSRGKIYATAAHARAAAAMLQRDKHLKPGWRYAVVVASRVNPTPAPAEKLYTDFHGEPPQSVKEHVLPEFSEGLEIGPVAAITYDTIRDGKKIRFEHEFAKRAAPLLITNGRTLALTGGRYRFTERGIVDREK